MPRVDLYEAAVSEIQDPAREAGRAIATMNLHSQRVLMTELAGAAAISGYSHEQIGERLGIGAAMVASILAGDRDLTLTEIRQLAYALDACVEYRVIPDMKNILAAADDKRGEGECGMD